MLIVRVLELIKLRITVLEGGLNYYCICHGKRHIWPPDVDFCQRKVMESPDRTGLSYLKEETDGLDETVLEE